MFGSEEDMCWNVSPMRRDYGSGAFCLFEYARKITSGGVVMVIKRNEDAFAVPPSRR